MLRHEPETPAVERRYDQETLRKVTSLAQRLQDQHQDTLSAQEIEAAGAEVGLAPEFIRQALARITPTPAKTVPVTAVAPATRVSTPTGKKRKALVAAWWSAAWVLPLLAIWWGRLVSEGNSGIFGFFLGLATYIGVGVYFSITAGETEPAAPRSHSRTDLLLALHSLERQLEASKVRRTFLSIDVAGSFQMREGEADLAVEYSFERFGAWARGIVEACNGVFYATPGDGAVGAFRDDAGALRAARLLQEGIGRFNVEQNRLSRPFRVRCGVNAGDVTLEGDTPLGHGSNPVVNQAAALQRQAVPGDIVVSESVAAAALVELGSLSRLPEAVSGQPAFSWRRGAGG